MDLRSVELQNPSCRTLVNALSSASVALDAAFRSQDRREDRVREAREALEAFKLLERTGGFVPRKVRRRVDWALSQLDRGNLELADSDIRWAGGAFQEALSAHRGVSRRA